MIRTQIYTEPFSRTCRPEEAGSHVDRTASQEEALKAAMDAAEAAVQAMKLTDDNNKKRELVMKSQELLHKAELIKNAETWPLHTNLMSGTKNIEVQRAKVEELKQPIPTRTLSTREQIILLQGSKLNGCIFPPWKTPDASEFVLDDGSEPFT